MRINNWMETMLQDLRYAVRVFIKSPVFTIVAVFTIALGTGVNTAIFTLFDLAFRPLPIKDANSVVRLDWGRWAEERWFTYPDYVYLRDHTKVLSGMIASSGGRPTLVLGGQSASEEPRRISGEFVSENFFSVLGASTVLGRTFTAEENAAGKHPYAVLSYPFWQRYFGGNPNVVGQTLQLNGTNFVVIGVTARSFFGFGVRPPDLWLPLLMRGQVPPQDRRGNWFESRNIRWLMVSGRLKPGRTMAEGNAEMGVLSGQLAPYIQEIEKKSGSNDQEINQVKRVRVTPALRFGFIPWELMGSVTLATMMVLLISIANIANLLLARAAGRQKEIGMRLCLGATRRRVVRQLLTENILLAVLGGGTGLVLAWWSIKAFLISTLPFQLLPSDPEWVSQNLSLDIRVLAYTFVLSLITGIAFGLVPALRSTRLDLATVVKDETTSFGQGMTRSRLRQGLVVAQLAFCLVLLIISGLVLRGLGRAADIDPGFDTGKILAVEPQLALAPGYDEARTQRFYQEFTERLKNQPGVLSVTQVLNAPLTGMPRKTISLKSDTVSERTARAYYNACAANYFETIGIPIVHGRSFTEEEVRSRSYVVVVTESTAQRLWPKQDPLGQLLRSDPNAPFAEVIGVVRNTQTKIDGSDPLQFYQPLSNLTGAAVLMRISTDAKEIEPKIRALARAMAPSLLVDTYTVEEVIDSSNDIKGARSILILSACLGLLALLLASMGLYGVIAYSVTQRRHEIGVRMALGARQRDVLWLVVSQGLRLIGIGVALGVVGGAAFSRAISSALFGLNPFDPIAYVSVSLFLALVALLATYLPARRASRVAPVEALRYE